MEISISSYSRKDGTLLSESTRIDDTIPSISEDEYADGIIRFLTGMTPEGVINEILRQKMEVEEAFPNEPA